MSDKHIIRDGRDADSADLIALIGVVYAEYPGCILDVEREEKVLLAPATRLAEMGGRFWVAEDDRGIAGCAGFKCRPDHAELVKLYVAKRARGRGLGTRLIDTVETAVSPAFARIELWTDSRFADAHRLYERLGYRRSPHPRVLDDLSRSTEFHYAKALDSPLARMSV
jgi:GNAT superfamily N-acetyltransferase